MAHLASGRACAAAETQGDCGAHTGRPLRVRRVETDCQVTGQQAPPSQTVNSTWRRRVGVRRYAVSEIIYFFSNSNKYRTEQKLCLKTGDLKRKKKLLPITSGDASRFLEACF